MTLLPILGLIAMIAIPVLAYRGIGYRMLYIAAVVVFVTFGAGCSMLAAQPDYRELAAWRIGPFLMTVAFGSLIGALIYRPRQV